MTATPASRLRPAVTALALAAGAAITLSACGAGQIAQTATQVAAVNGNGADQGTISLRNVHVAYPTSEQFSLEPGGRAELVFTAINTSETTADRLVGIETEGASEVVVGGAFGTTGGEFDVEIPAQATVGAGVPVQAPVDAIDPAENSTYINVELEDLSENVRPGLTVPMTFSFENAGDVVVSVPVDPGPLTPRVTDAISGPAESEHAEGGH